MSEDILEEHSEKCMGQVPELSWSRVEAEGGNI